LNQTYEKAMKIITLEIQVWWTIHRYFMALYYHENLAWWTIIHKYSMMPDFPYCCENPMKN